MEVNYKQLTAQQRDMAANTAQKRAKSQVKLPNRKDFEFERANTHTTLYAMAIIVFFAAFLISATHIIHVVGQQVVSLCGTDVICTWLNNIGYLFLADTGMIVFMAMHSRTVANRRAQENWSERGVFKYFSIHGALALLAALFVLYANSASQVGMPLFTIGDNLVISFESILPPILTIGLGYVLEQWLFDRASYNAEVDREYHKQRDLYHLVQANPKQHPDYEQFYREAVWEKLTSLKANQHLSEYPAQVKAAIVAREKKQADWMEFDEEEVAKSTENFPLNLSTQINEFKPQNRAITMERVESLRQNGSSQN